MCGAAPFKMDSIAWVLYCLCFRPANSVAFRRHACHGVESRALHIFISSSLPTNAVLVTALNTVSIACTPKNFPSQASTKALAIVFPINVAILLIAHDVPFLTPSFDTSSAVSASLRWS